MPSMSSTRSVMGKFKTPSRGMAALLIVLLLAVSVGCQRATPTAVSGESSSSFAAPLLVHVMDVGNADAILVQQGESSLLIDAGNNSDGDDIVAFLRRQGVRSLDYAIATHPHADHIGGMDTVVKEIPIDTFLMPDIPESLIPTTLTYLDLLEALDMRNVDVEAATAGEQYPLGDASFSILSPDREYRSLNNMSVVCRVDFGKRRFLFMGDAEKEVENALLASRMDLHADFIKVGHHGSHTSSGENFLRAVAPRFAAIPCGFNNRYGHPSPAVLSTLEKLNIAYFRCDMNGTIRAVCDGDNIHVTTAK